MLLNMDKSKYFSDKVKHLEASAIREIFKMLGKPGIISFAGGNPAPAMFPNERLSYIAKDILRNNGNVSLQYGISEGYLPLRDWVKDKLEAMGIKKDVNETIIVSGGQQGIDLSVKSLINPGDGIVCEEPSFIGGLNCFRSYNAKIYGAPIQEDGMDLDVLEQYCKDEDNIKLVYTIPTFQNPTGITMSLEKRKRLLELAEKYDFLILEDDPYSELRYKGEAVPSIKSMDSEGRVIYVGSFSKIIAPGLRVGYVSADAVLVERMIICKQVSDVHTNLLAQMAVHEFVKSGELEEHITNICTLYGRRCKTMINCIHEYFPQSITHTNPEGGLFIFCTMPEGVDSKVVMKKALEKNVAFVPGATTMIDDKKTYNTFRLNYSMVSSEKITTGIKMLGHVLCHELGE